MKHGVFPTGLRASFLQKNMISNLPNLKAPMKIIFCLPLIFLLANCTGIRVSNQTGNTLKNVYAIYGGDEGEKIGENIAPGESCKTSRDLFLTKDEVRIVGVAEGKKRYEVFSTIEAFKMYDLSLTPNSLKR